MRIDLVLLSAAYLLAAHAPAYAYLDPGTGSILLQGILCAVASGLFILKTYWAKAKVMLGLAPQPAADTTQVSDQA